MKSEFLLVLLVKIWVSCGVLGVIELCSSFFAWLKCVEERNNLNMERKHKSSKSVKLEGEISGIWSRWARAVLKAVSYVVVM